MAVAPTLECDRFDRYLFVPNRTSPDIAVIDIDLDEVIGRIRVQDVPDQLIVSGTRAKLVATHAETRKATVFDLQTRQIEAVLTLDFRPEQLTLDPSGRTFAVSSSAADRLSVVSLKPVQNVFQLSGLGRPSDLMFSRDTRLLFVASGLEPRVAVVDAWDGNMVGQLVFGGPAATGIEGLASAKQLGFALLGASGEISVFDMLEQSPIATLVVPGPAKFAAATADGLKLLVPNGRDGTISIIAAWPTRHLAEIARVPAPSAISGIYAGASDGSAFLVSPDSEAMAVLSLRYMSTQGELVLPAQPEGGITMEGGRKLYLALRGSDQVAVIDMENAALLTLIDGVGHEPSAVQAVGAFGPCQ